jgi:hypothetical protein
MCKNNLGCAGTQNCGCPSCGKKYDAKKITDKSIQTATFEPSGYGKKQKSLAPLPSGSGYSKKNIIPSGNKKPVSPMVETIPNKEDDNMGIIVSSVGLGLIILTAAVVKS